MSSASVSSGDQVTTHFLYKRAMDLRLQLILYKLNIKILPVSTKRRLLERFPSKQVEIIIVDVGSDLESGAQLIEELIRRIKFSLIVPVCDGGSIEFFRRCFVAGATDVLDKSFDDKYITKAFQWIQVVRCSPPSVLISFRQRKIRFSLLTEREEEVFFYLADGLTSREIAELFALSIRTVEAHRAHIQEKLGVRNVAQMLGEYSIFLKANILKSESIQFPFLNFSP